MKKFLLSAASAFVALGASAQLPVSTTPENKNVILEEFTGIYCTFCPDGHKIASQIKAGSPNDVFLINIHTGGYANPQGGDPDFRTAFGSALAGQSGLSGYPAGTVNRHVFPGNSGTAMGRGNWSSAASTIMGESSYVNLALEADIDVATRVMTVDLEAYFTANGASSVNINVAVLQNNVEGPQTGGSTYNPGNVLPNGNYNHQHMLRHMITGQWGDVVTTTTQGTTVSRQYTWTIPTDINGVAVEIGDLEIVGFVVEGQQEVISGSDGPVSFTIPPGSTLIDLETADNTVYPSNYCASTVVPEVVVTNVEANSCSGYTVSYSINGGTPVTQTINTALAAGASATHTFPAATITPGEQTITYNVELLPGSNEVEIVQGNNSSASDMFLTIDPAAVAPPVMDDMEVQIGSYPANMTTLNPDGIRVFTVTNQIVQGGLPYDLGGYGNSTSSLRFDFITVPAGMGASVFFDKINLDGMGNAFVTFDRAYSGSQGNNNDKLEVKVSTDCGATWDVVWMKTGNDLANATPPAAGSRFYAAPTEWVTDTVNIGGYVGNDVLVMLTGTSAEGNCLYIDNVSVSGWTVGVEELFDANAVTVYPNPAKDAATLSIESAESQAVTVQVLDMAGRVVYTTIEALANGTNAIELDIANLENGVYFVEISAENKTTTERLVIQK